MSTGNLFAASGAMLQYLPKAFWCAGCSHPSWVTVCNSCKYSLHFNERILPPPVVELEGVAPLLYSFHRTQKLIRHWKEHGGEDLRKLLFSMPLNLQRHLMELHLFAIVPIPQDPKRSKRRRQESAVEVAKFYSEKLNVPLVTLLELQSRGTKQQTGQNRFDREFSPSPFRLRQNALFDSTPGRYLAQKVEENKSVRILLVDDLLTSGSTFAKASALIQGWIPDARIWAGSLGFRPYSNIRDSQSEKDLPIPAADVPAFQLNQGPSPLLLASQPREEQC